MPLIKGAVITFTDGTTGIVESKIGEGGQGEVYLVTHQGKSKALKWYKGHPTSVFMDNLKRNASSGCPSPSFLWPIAVTDSKLGAGYIMDLKGKDYYDFSKFLANKYHFKDETTAISAAINLCLAFQKLHLQGLAYFDLNDGNFFFNPNTAGLQIGDNDNVSSANFNVSNIGGKRGYMAPEVVLESTPNRYSDYYSLAIILFRLFFIDHPLHGSNMERFACLTPNAIKYLYGTHPIFIFDPANQENKATNEFSPNAIKRWNCVPEFVRQTFIRAFSLGVKPEQRLMESQWIKVFQRWRSSLCTCPQCGRPTYIEPIYRGKCPECHQSMKIFWMQVDYKEYVPLVKGQVLYSSQIGLGEYFQVAAEIVSAKNNNNLLGIRNMSPMDWNVSYGDRQKLIKNGDAFQLADGIIIKISNIKTLTIKLVNPA